MQDSGGREVNHREHFTLSPQKWGTAKQKRGDEVCLREAVDIYSLGICAFLEMAALERGIAGEW